MAQLPTKFSATDHDTTQNKRDGFPDMLTGIYRLQVEASDAKETAKGGFGANMTIEVLEPVEAEKRKLFEYYYLQNADSTPGFGADDFASLVRATKQGPEIGDTEELHFFPFTARLGWSAIQYEKDGNKKFIMDSAGNKVVKNEARMEIKEYFFDTDEDGNDLEIPDAAFDEVQVPKPLPVGMAAPANDNRAAANDNAPAKAAPAKAAGSKPWAKK